MHKIQARMYLNFCVCTPPDVVAQRPSLWHHCRLLTPSTKHHGVAGARQGCLAVRTPTSSQEKQWKHLPMKRAGYFTQHCSHPKHRAIPESFTKTGFRLVPRNSKLTSRIPPEQNSPLHTSWEKKKNPHNPFHKKSEGFF